MSRLVAIMDRRRFATDVKKFDAEAAGPACTFRRPFMERLPVSLRDHAVQVIQKFLSPDVDPESLEMVVKVGQPPPIERELLDLEDGSGQTVQWVSTREVDRDGEVVMPGGLMLDEFKSTGMPVLFGHDYRSPPIGNDLWIKAYPRKNPFGLLARTQYDMADATAAAIFGKKQRGVMRSQSIGFLPTEVKRNGEQGWDDLLKGFGKSYGDDYAHAVSQARNVITKGILWEHSDVSVPSNPFANQVAVSRDADSQRTARRRLPVRRRLLECEA